MTAVMIESGHLGPVEVDDHSVVEFPAGIIGFPDQRRYALVAAEESGLYSWLQSVDEPDLAFLALVPAPSGGAGDVARASRGRGRRGAGAHRALLLADR